MLAIAHDTHATAPAAPPSHAASGWKAELDLEFAPGSGRTILSRRSHRGPLAVQRPFHPEANGACHVYVLHPPGGIVGGDSLRLNATVRPEAHALVTSPAAGKFYRSAGPVGRQVQTLRVDSGATLEWLPQETIVYPGANACQKTRVELTGQAFFLGWEIICLGLPASEQPFSRGSFRQSFEIFRDEEPLLLERALYAGGAGILSQPWGLGGCTVFGALYATGGSATTIERIRKGVKPFSEKGRCALTHMDGLTVCRAMGHNAFKVRDLLAIAWSELRQDILGCPPCPPRVWNT